jgi:glycosyltransferase involved in cell wall biosynthesis
MNIIYKPKISVVIPCYNSEKYVEETIDSVLNQSFKDFELIIVNDGSTDSTSEILKKNTKKSNKISIINIENSGVQIAFIQGILSSNANLIARIDSDDLMIKNRLEVQFNYFSQNPEFDAIGSWFKKISSNNTSSSVIERLPLSPLVTKSLMCFFNQIANPTTIIKKSLFHNYDQSYTKIGEDLNFWLHSISNNYQIGNIPNVLTQYRVHDKQATANKELTYNLTNVVYDKNINNLVKSDINKSFIEFGILYRKGVSIKETSLFFQEYIDEFKREELRYGNLDALSDCLFRVYSNSLGNRMDIMRYILIDFYKYNLNLNVIEKIIKLSNIK